ncbi:MAG: hypothetical protein QOK40_2434 [Miltoncostaeaceae bacterium]|nr:hypothetical protein [Miltoncostaeaceae bacterium]
MARTAWLYGSGGRNFVDTMRPLGAACASTTVPTLTSAKRAGHDELANSGPSQRARERLASLSSCAGQDSV